MKKFKLVLSSLLIFALTTVYVYSQSNNTELPDKISNGTLLDNAESDIQFNEHDKVHQVNQTVTSKIDGLVAYGYVPYTGSGGFPKGPASFDLDDPGTLTSLGPGAAIDFLSAGTWANSTWYGVENGGGDLYEINPFDGRTSGTIYRIKIVIIIVNTKNITHGITTHTNH